MDKVVRVMIKISIFILNLLFLGLITYLYLGNLIIFEGYIAILFFQLLICSLALCLYLFIYKRMQSLSSSLGFSYIRGTFPHPKFEGHYKGNWFQIHFVSRDRGSSWGQPRTYIKLQYKEKKEFDKSALEKYAGTKLNESRIVSVEHIVRDYKNYVLLKREWFTFSKRKIQGLMDLLIKISSEAEVKKAKKQAKKPNRRI